MKYRLINETTVDRLCQDLKIEDWNDVYDKINPQDAYSCFYNKLFQLYDKNIPLTKTKNKGNSNSQKNTLGNKGYS